MTAADTDTDLDTGGRPGPSAAASAKGRGTKDHFVTRRVVRWIDTRLGTAKLARTALGKVFPDHWSFLIGEIALYAFIVLLLTGTYLTFFFDASSQDTVYRGSYAALRGVHMSQAYRSAVDLSFDVRAGLVMRQIHHWAALLFIAAIVVHLMRIFFTGAFRKPRELNWMVGVTLLILAIFNGFAGYSLLDDQLSGTGLRIAYSITLSIPVAGTWLASLLFGGEFPGRDIIERLFVIHILLIPALIVVLLVAHLGILVRQKHTQFPGPGRRESNVVGERVWPSFAFKSLGMMMLTTAMVCLLGGLAQINPIWLYGPFRPAEVSSASQPDWYMGWLDGALRLYPGWELRAFGFEVPAPFFPAVLLAGLTFTALYLWPFLEARVTRDRASHHLLDRPRDRPVRTALGVATLSFYAVCTMAASSDVTATTFNLSVNAVLWSFRVLLLLAPVVTGRVAYSLCQELTRRDAEEAAGPTDERDEPTVTGNGNDGAAEVTDPEAVEEDLQLSPLAD